MIFFYFQPRAGAVSSPFGDFSTTPNPVVLSSTSGQNPGVSGGNPSAASIAADTNYSRAAAGGDSGAADERNRLDPFFASGKWRRY